MTEILGMSPEETIIADRLKGQWIELVSSVDGNTDQIGTEFDELAKMYRESARSYHNLLHIGNVDRMLNRYRHLAKSFIALKFAGDGHDAVYIPNSETNEVDSAIYMRGSLQRLGVPASIISETERIIGITKDHKTTAGDIDGKLMIDADFAIFASPPEQYDVYAQGIWQEYVGSGKVDADRFKIGRSALIRGWLKQPRIFLVDQIRDELESVAKQNLERELDRLSS